MPKWQRITTILGITLAVVFSIHKGSFAAPPSIISYQGRLTNASGDLLGGSSGTTYYFRFAIFSDAAGGTQLWPAGTPSVASLTVQNGVFNAAIGDTSAGFDALTLDFETDPSVYLQIQISTAITFSNSETLTPRQRILSSGFAVNADTVDGAHAGTAANNVMRLGSSAEINLAAFFDVTGTAAPAVSSASEGRIYFDSTTNTFRVSENGGAYANLVGLSSLAWSGLTAPTANLSLSMAEYTSTLAWNTGATAAAFDGLTLSLTNDATTDTTTQRGLVVKNESATGGTTERLLVLENADDSALTTALEIVGSSTGAITTAIDVSDTQIGNALNIGGNFALFDGVRIFEGTTGTLTIEDTSGNDLLTVVDGGTAGNITATGTLTAGGNIAPSANDGGSLGISGTAFADLFLASGSVVNFNAGDVTLTHASNALTVAGGTFTLTDALDANGDVSIADTDIAFDGASTTFTTTGAFTLTPGGAVILGDNGDTLRINSSDWDITTAGVMTGIGAITQSPDATLGTPSSTGAWFSQAAQTFTDNANSGVTVAAMVFNSFAQPTLNSNDPNTYTDVATLYIANAPADGGNPTITNAHALWVDAGISRFDGAVYVIPQTTGTHLDFQLETEWTTGDLINADFASATTLTGTVIGLDLDLDTNVTGVSGSNLTGARVQTPTLSSTASTTYNAFEVAASGALTHNTAGTLSWRGLDIAMPNGTQTGATLAIAGVRAANGSLTTGGTQNIFHAVATGVGAGTLNALEIDGITAGSGTESAIKIGAGWDADLAFADTGVIVSIGGGGTLSFTDGTNTLAVVRDQGDYGFVNIDPKGDTGDPASCAIGDIYVNTTDATVKACTATNTWEALDGGGGWNDGGTDITLSTSTDNVGVGGASLAKFSVDGDADEIQLLIQGNATQTSLLSVFENSAGTDVFTIANSGALAIDPTTTGTMLDFELADQWDSGTLIVANFGAANTQTGDMIGLQFDFDTNLTGAADADITGTDVIMNALAAADTAVTTTYTGYNISAAGALSVTDGANAAVLNWRGVNLTLPAITQNTGDTVTADGLRVLIPASAAITTAGTMSGVSIVAPTTSGPAAGTLYGMQIGNLTSAGAGTEEAITIGTGWDRYIAAGGALAADGANTITAHAVSVVSSTDIDANGENLVVIQGSGTTYSGGLANAAMVRIEYTGTGVTDSETAPYMLRLETEDNDINLILVEDAGDGIDIFKLDDGGNLILKPVDDDDDAFVIDGQYVTSKSLIELKSRNDSDEVISVRYDTNNVTTTDSTNNVMIGMRVSSGATWQVDSNANAAVLTLINFDVLGALHLGSTAAEATEAVTFMGIDLDLSTNVTGTNDTIIGARFTVPNGGVTGATTGIDIEGAPDVDIDLQLDDQILNTTAGNIELQGVGGSDDSDILFDLDGTRPVISSPTDAIIEIAEDVEISGSNLFLALDNEDSRNFALCVAVDDGGATPGTTLQEVDDCDTAAGADYAERYPVAPGITYGDIVVPGAKVVETNDKYIGKQQIVQLVKSSQSYQEPIMGIVSNNYGDFTSAGANISKDENPMPVALVGRVPVNVTNENGPIAVGDFLTTSSTAGMAMRATRSGRVLGMALGRFDSERGQVMIQVLNTFWNGPDQLTVSQDANGMIVDAASGAMNLRGGSLAGVAEILSANGTWSIDPSGNLSVKIVQAEEVKTQKLTIEGGKVVGRGYFTAGKTSVKIQNEAVTGDSLIFVTFRLNPEAYHWVSELGSGYFMVSLSKPAGADYDFDYWIVNTDGQFSNNPQITTNEETNGDELDGSALSPPFQGLRLGEPSGSERGDEGVVSSGEIDTTPAPPQGGGEITLEDSSSPDAGEGDSEETTNDESVPAEEVPVVEEVPVEEVPAEEIATEETPAEDVLTETVVEEPVSNPLIDTNETTDNEESVPVEEIPLDETP